MPRFLRPNIGSRRNRLKAVAKAVTCSFRPIQSVIGFGSSFRPGRFSDIDLLIIVSIRPRYFKTDEARAKGLLKSRLPKWHIPIDVLVLSEREMRNQPLRDMHLLETLYCRRSHGSDTRSGRKLKLQNTQLSKRPSASLRRASVRS